MTRKILSYITAVMLLMAILAGFSGCGTKPATAPDQVTFYLNWLPEDPFYWAALDKGFWNKQNLEVKIVKGSGSADALSKIAAQKAEFGMADTSTVILGRLKDDIKAKVVANFSTYFPGVIMYNKSSGINQPKDLEGKTIVSSASSAYRLFWPAFAQANGIDEGKVQWKLVDPSLQQTAFVRGEVDAWTSDIENLPSVEKLTGGPIQFFSYKDHGNLDRYGESIFVHEDTIAQKPDLVRRFVAGYLEGVRYCLENPAQVGEIIKKHVPEIDTELAVKTWQVNMSNNVITSEESRKNGLGWMSSERMQRTIDSVSKAYGLQKTVAPEVIYTTEFLPEKPVYPPSE